MTDMTDMTEVMGVMERVDLETMKIFLVDDSHILRGRMHQTVAALGEAEIVGETDSAIDAIDAIKKTQPHVVVLDIRLRVGSGLDVLHEIKRYGRNDTVVIVMTNYPYAQYRRVSMRMGADYFFHKATQFPEVIKTLRDLKSMCLKDG
jgi:DNA-binding NarL/FixJ family response regulator